MRITFDKSTRAIILSMIALVIIAFFIARNYYQMQNKAVDPRVVPARQLYARYNSYAAQGDYTAIFTLLDSVENMYNSIPHYKNSFEVGVVQVNKGAIYLTLAVQLSDTLITINGMEAISKDSLLNLGEHHTLNAIDIYEKWLNTFEGKSEETLLNFITEQFFIELEAYNSEDQNKYLRKRVDELLAAQYETKRRLSVAYTNLGIVMRHREQYEAALENYQKALDLWDKNLTAENNINKLLGRPLKKRNVIQKLFPPEKD